MNRSKRFKTKIENGPTGIDQKATAKALLESGELFGKPLDWETIARLTAIVDSGEPKRKTESQKLFDFDRKLKMESKPEYRFYATDWGTNGTNDLIITDIDGQVIEYLESILFGINIMGKTSLLAIFDGESVFGTNQDIGDIAGLDHDLVRSIDSDDILQYIAISPIDSENDQITKLKPYIAA